MKLLHDNIMKLKTRYIWILIMAALVQGSCSDDLLTPKPLSFFAPENVYVDKAGYEASLVTMRRSLTEGITGSRRYYMVGEWAASEAGNPTFQLDWTQTTPFFDKYYTFLGLFTDSYEFIKNANVVIGRIDDIEWDSDDDRNRILAEAYWHRAYWYYWLVNSYGDVPFVGEEVKDVKLDYQTHSRWAILNKIQADLEFAVQWLPETAVPGAITKGAGNHLLTKVYLANLEFDKAISSATKLIDGRYSLMTSRFGTSLSESKKDVIWDLHRPDNKNISENKETILAIVDRFEAPAGAQTDGLFTMRHYHPSWWHQNVKDSQGQAGMVDSGPKYDSLGRGNPDLVITSYASYDIWKGLNFDWTNTTDKRRSNENWVDKHEITYNNPNSVDYGKPVNTKWIPNQQDSVQLIFPMPIYKTYVRQQSPSARPVGGNGDWYIFRLAETYLLRAEAYFWKDQLGNAAADINKVRERAAAVPISAGDVTLGYIFDERARELFIEAPRHAEMVRASYILAKLNKDGYSLNSFSEKNWWYDRVIELNEMYTIKPILDGNTPKVEPYHVLWPIDNNVILANSLGRINQNKGYSGAENNQPPLETIEEPKDE